MLINREVLINSLMPFRCNPGFAGRNPDSPVSSTVNAEVALSQE